MAGTSEIAKWIDALTDVAKETARELSRPDLDPDRVAELMQRRVKAFAALQEAHASALGTGAVEAGGGFDDPDLKKLVDELLALDRSNMATMEQRLNQLRSDVSQASLQRRTLTAYGWVDPEHGPKGAFIDKTQG